MTFDRGTEENDESQREAHGAVKRQPATNDLRVPRRLGLALQILMIDRRTRAFVLPIPVIDRRAHGTRNPARW